MLSQRSSTLEANVRSTSHCIMMEEIILKLDNLCALSSIPDERKELDWAQERLLRGGSHSLQCIQEPKLSLLKKLSSFLDLIISGRAIEPHGDFCYTWKLWEYVDAIETCDRKVTEYNGVNVDTCRRDYQLDERREEKVPVSVDGEAVWKGKRRE